MLTKNLKTKIRRQKRVVTIIKCNKTVFEKINNLVADSYHPLFCYDMIDYIKRSFKENQKKVSFLDAYYETLRNWASNLM